MMTTGMRFMRARNNHTDLRLNRNTNGDIMVDWVNWMKGALSEFRIGSAPFVDYGDSESCYLKHSWDKNNYC